MPGNLRKCPLPRQLYKSSTTGPHAGAPPGDESSSRMGRGSNIGVSVDSRQVGYRTGSAAGDRRNDRDAGAVRHGGGETLGKADIVIVDIDVHETTEFSGLVENPGGNTRMILFERLDHRGQRVALGRDLGLAAGVGAQDGGDSDGSTHARPASRNAATVGRMVAVGPVVGDTASRVLSPSPVLSTTVSAAGSSCPVSISFLSTPTVTPPAVSAKMPSVRASSLMASTTCSSS